MGVMYGGMLINADVGSAGPVLAHSRRRIQNVTMTDGRAIETPRDPVLLFQILYGTIDVLGIVLGMESPAV